MSILGRAAQFVLGPILGDVYPPAPARSLPDFDARTRALRRFCDFIAALDFSRTGNKNAAPTSYRIPRDQVFEEQPDDPERLRFPSVAILPGRGVHDNWRLGPVQLIDETLDMFGRGTALADLGEYVEPILIESWGSHPAERRSVLAGIESVIRLGQRSSALRLSLPDYWNRVATFQLNESQYVDDPDIVRGRRRGQIMLDLRVQEVMLVDVKTLRPAVDVGIVDDLEQDQDEWADKLRQPPIPGP